MKGLKVSQIVQLLGVSNVTIYKKLKQFETQLEGKLYKEKNVLFLMPEAVEIIKKSISIDTTVNEAGTSNTSNQFETKIETILKRQLEKIEQQMEIKDSELKRKDTIINKLLENQSKLIEGHSQDRERTDTIIMKLTQDLEYTKHLLLENKTVDKQMDISKGKDKYHPEKSPHRATDKVISIEEYIDSKVSEEKERSDFERLNNQLLNPLQGKSILYRTFVKLFRPDMMRQNFSRKSNV